MVSKTSLQDLFLNSVRKENTDITVYLMNGVPLQGRVASFDNFTILLEVDCKFNLVYKHAVSTMVPQKPITIKHDGE